MPFRRSNRRCDTVRGATLSKAVLTGAANGLTVTGNGVDHDKADTQSNIRKHFHADGPLRGPTPHDGLIHDSTDSVTCAPSFTWGDLPGHDASHAIQAAYSEVVHWLRNHFKIPWGSSGKEFVQEISRLLRAFAEGPALVLSSIALKAAMLLPSLAETSRLIALEGTCSPSRAAPQSLTFWRFQRSANRGSCHTKSPERSFAKEGVVESGGKLLEINDARQDQSGPPFIVGRRTRTSPVSADQN